LKARTQTRRRRKRRRRRRRILPEIPESALYYTGSMYKIPGIYCCTA